MDGCSGGQSGKSRLFHATESGKNGDRRCGEEELFAQAIGHFGRDAPEAWQTAYVDPSARGCTLAHMIVEAYLSKEHLEDRDGFVPVDPTFHRHDARDFHRPGCLSTGTGHDGRRFRSQSGGRGSRCLRARLGACRLCVGGMGLARAVDRQDLADDIRNAARGLVLETSGWGNSAAATAEAGSP
ncbi:MAG TPA: hypothetical protein VG271_01290 [Beijerinckiaceae bacterium]|nr:hypothetical protein [Beijerinckiaceae bacterium]